MFKRVVIKLSGESLAGNTSGSYDRDTVENIAEEIKTTVQKGAEVSLVIGGGNIWRGRDIWRDGKYSMDGAKADQIGMLATVMNAIFLADAFKQVGIETNIMTPFVIGTMSEQFSKDTALKYLKDKHVLIFAGGTGLPFFSTDTVTAVRAAELEADIILFAKNGVDGIYDSDPNKNADAVKYDKITYQEIIRKNLQAIDIAAISICEQQNIRSLVFGMDNKGSISGAVEGVSDGTIVLPNSMKGEKNYVGKN